MNTLGVPEDSEMRCVVGIPAGAWFSQRLVLDLIEAVTPYVAAVSEPFAVGFGVGSDAYNSIIIDVGAGTVDTVTTTVLFLRRIRRQLAVVTTSTTNCVD